MLLHVAVVEPGAGSVLAPGDAEALSRAERAGVLEDYILTSAKVIKGSAPSAAAPQARPGEPVGTSGAASMFDVKGMDDARLKEFVGKRVQIDGTFADVEKSPSAGRTEDLIDLRATAIRPAAGDCSAK